MEVIPEPVDTRQRSNPPKGLVLEKYKGDISANDWLEEFLSHVGAHEWSEEEAFKYFPLYLEGVAKTWYRNIKHGL